MRVVAKIARPLDNAGNLKAIASITLDDSFAVHGVKVLKSQKGLFVAMPSTEFNSEYKDICHFSSLYRHDRNCYALTVPSLFGRKWEFEG